MPDPLPPGPYKTFQLPDGKSLAMYVIPFDKQARCQAPRTRDALLSDIQNGNYTDVYLFSHGWNNDWPTATARYESFARGYMKMRTDGNFRLDRGDYKPLLVGIFWPGIILMSEDENAPLMASAAGAPDDVQVALERQRIAELAELIPPEKVERFYELTQRPGLAAAEARELAGLLGSVYTTDDDVRWPSAPTIDDILAAWRSLGAPEESAEALGTVGTVDAGSGPLRIAGGGEDGGFDPRDILRVFTVWQMKDRAGRIGTKGVGPLLAGIRARTGARLHLIGHSYGCKVLLSAILAADNLDGAGKQVDSLLLLEAAVNHLCFTDRVPDRDYPGGYRRVLSRVRQPILTTYSSHDFPLTKVFHLALRRNADRGEIRISAAFAAIPEPAVPSVFAALGGFGPRAAGEHLLLIKDIGAPYDETRAADAPRVFGLDGSQFISSHGDVVNRATWWALFEQVSEGKWSRP